MQVGGGAEVFLLNFLRGNFYQHIPFSEAVYSSVRHFLIKFENRLLSPSISETV